MQVWCSLLYSSLRPSYFWNFMKYHFITWWTFFFECRCNGLLNCVPFAYNKICFGYRYTLRSFQVLKIICKCTLKFLDLGGYSFIVQHLEDDLNVMHGQMPCYKIIVTVANVHVYLTVLWPISHICDFCKFMDIIMQITSGELLSYFIHLLP